VRNLVYSSIAKNPADRPATAAHMARAAQSLRRGDVAAAAAAVPGVIGSGSLANTAGANYGKPSDATTRLLPSPVTTSTAEIPRKRSPWTWPLIAFIAVVAVVLIAVLITLLNPPTEDEPSPPPSSSPPVSQPSITPTATAIVVDKANIEGSTQAQVDAYLKGLGLVLDPRVGKPASSVEQVGIAYLVNPTGKVQKGAVIAVTFYGELPKPTATPTLTVDGGTTKPVDGEATILWSKYLCPSGFDVTGYQFTYTNATAPASPNPVGPDVNSLVLELPSTPGSVTIKYYAQCGDAGNSPESAVTTITVE